MAGSKEVLALYRRLLRESSKFSSYSFRTYALRRVKDAFREHQSETEKEKVASLVENARQSLEIINRQVVIGQMYKDPTLVIEKPKVDK